MLFNSLHYLVFFPVVVSVFFALPARLRTTFLVVASCYFYMVFKPVYILILFAVITIDYASGIYIEQSTGLNRRIGLIVSLLSNIGILFVFKYYAFAAENLHQVAHVFGLSVAAPKLDLLLPIGLSFHTFQSLAYIVEVFNGRFPAERNPIRFALYVLFFPQMVAGPIERPQGLLRQLQRLDQTFSYDDAVAGLRLILVGFWCKLLVADNLAPYVDQVFATTSTASGLSAALATVCFAIQIYGDFHGYSLIAIGSARVLGIRLATNFNHPYSATSIADFWHRWHISLSTWFRDYVYFPLGGNRVGVWRGDLNLMVVFLLSGLWHGASWTYVVWGGLHGLYLILERRLRSATRWRGVTWMSRLVVVALVSIAWIFFRARTLSDAGFMLQAIGLRWSSVGAELRALSGQLLVADTLVNGAAMGLAAYAVLTFVIEPLAAHDWRRLTLPARWGLYYVMVASILMFAKFDSRTFIYFQF